MSSTAVTLADIVTSDWSVKLDTPGVPGSGLGLVVQGLDDISQCLLIICSTPQGSDPLRPLFGANIFQYIDFPIQLAIPAIVQALTEAITRWEPRINLQSISAALVTKATSPGVAGNQGTFPDVSGVGDFSQITDISQLAGATSTSGGGITNIQAGAQMLISMTWQLKISGVQGQTTVTLPFGR